MIQSKKWKDRIKRAKKRGKFTDGDLSDAVRWCSCAVGEAFPAKVSEPYVSLGETVFALGNEFFSAVEENNIIKAEQIYDAIQSAK